MNERYSEILFIIIILIAIFCFEGVKEESLEDLQKTFVEMFGGDLAKMMENKDPTVAKKRARDGGCGSNSRRTSSNCSSYYC